MLSLSRTLYDEEKCAERKVCAMANTPKSGEAARLVVAYDCQRSKQLTQAGLIAVWNSGFGNTPEFYFDCPSSVTALVCNERQPHLITAGSRSGQLFVWDTRHRSRWPVLKSFVSLASHYDAVMAMRMVDESTGGQSLLSASSEGRLCKWAADDLTIPVESAVLRRPTDTEKDLNTAPHSITFINDDEFLIGGDSNDICYGNIRYNMKEMAKIKKEEEEEDDDDEGRGGGKYVELSQSITAHQFSVSCLDAHPSSGPTDFSSLCLSGSVDFAVKLWNVRDARLHIDSRSDGTTGYDDFDCYAEHQPLVVGWEHAHRFPVVGVGWSPAHPATFVSSSAEGLLHLWQLNANVEEPVWSQRLGSPTTKLLWSRNGQYLAVGDTRGCVKLLSVEDKDLYLPENKEWTKLQETLSGLRALASKRRQVMVQLAKYVQSE